MKEKFRKFLPVVVDMETGGFDPVNDALLEIAITLIDYDKEFRVGTTHRHHIIPFEGLNVSEESLEFTGIDLNHPLRNAVDEKEALKTYKFFPTPDHIKSYLQNELIKESSLFINSNTQKPESNELQNILNELVTSLINYFNESSPAKKLILDSSVFGAQINSLSILSESINKFVSSNIELPSMFNEKGVFLVLTQIIISVLSLNYKMDRELNDIGKNEAVRASLSYLIACTAKQ